MAANVCFAGRQIVYPKDRARNHFPDVPYRFGEPTTWRNKLAFLVLSTDFLFCFVFCFFFPSFFLPSRFFFPFFVFFFFYFLFRFIQRDVSDLSRTFHLANENLDDRDQF